MHRPGRKDFNIDDVFDKELVGEGTYGMVYRARRKDARDGMDVHNHGSDIIPYASMSGKSQRANGRPDARQYALKVTKNNVHPPDGLSVSVCREIALLQDLDHPNIIRIQRIMFTSATQQVWLQFDYAEYDLWTVLNYHRNLNKGTITAYPSDVMQKSMTHQILSGIDYLHANWVLHRDLKPANILVMGPGPELGRIKIADLGMARLFHNPLKPLSEVDPVVVTYWYRSPELLLGAKHYTKAIADSSKESYHKEQLEAIFRVLGRPVSRSTGIGSVSSLEWKQMEFLPYYGRMQEDFKDKAFEGSLDKAVKCTTASKQALLSGLLRYDPQLRFSAAQALAQPYFTEDPLPLPK